MKLIDRIKNRVKIRERLKLQGRAKFGVSLNHALDGISYTIFHERNLRIELFFAIMVIIGACLFRVSLIEWGILILTIGIILALEIVNTAIERSVDLVTKDYAELAKIAKDTSAGAVLIMSFISVIIGIIIFLPRIIELVNNW